MKSEIIEVPDNACVPSEEIYLTNSEPVSYSPLNNIQAGHVVDELLASAKDNRLNTKRAISADIAASEDLRSQNNLVITCCKQELQRKDYSKEDYLEIMQIMDNARQSTENEINSSREFQKELIVESNKASSKVIELGIALLIGVAIGKVTQKN
ncbi:hypothetical protein [Faecalibaculum rodentium]|jgi:hypothetical protein|uniref:hypothetical protein n=1 Tax=Faecalibaculum rodentium TaxID=1702221 RepID=UPI0025B1AA78|nr:hypothetical protein [Faecalibaculum rodentium]